MLCFSRKPQTFGANANAKRNCDSVRKLCISTYVKQRVFKALTVNPAMIAAPAAIEVIAKTNVIVLGCEQLLLFDAPFSIVQ